MIAPLSSSRRWPVLGSVLASFVTLTNSAAWAQAPQLPPDAPTTTQEAATPRPGPAPQIIAVPVPLALPGQLKPLMMSSPVVEPIDPRRRIGHANEAARVQPDRTSWLNAIQQYAWADGALYQVYAAPGQVTDVVLQDGEELVGGGAVAAGDTVRWIIGDTMSGTGTAKKVHILIKPTRGDIATNLVINTDRRTYHLELRATPSTYMAAVSWSYPADTLIALRSAHAEQEKVAPIAGGVDVTALNFHYTIDGDKPAWRPLRAFDDGHQAFIEFPTSIGTGDMPPLFMTGVDGKAELVNYRVQGRYMVVDRLFGGAELRFGTKKSQQVVRITRDDTRKGKRS